MKSSIFSITKVKQNNINYLNINLTEGVSGDNFSLKLKEGSDISRDFIENFEDSYSAWQSLSSDTRMPWSNSLLAELKHQVDRFNNYQHYISGIHVSDIMSSNPHTFGPSTPVLNAAQDIIDMRISGAPVVDDKGNLIGIVSEKDILSSLFEETTSNSKKLAKSGALEMESMSKDISEIMIKNVLSSKLGDEITPALRIMQDNNLRRMPVVDGEKLVGIISIGDIHRAIFKSCINK